MSSGNREDYLINILRLTEGERVAKTTELADFMQVSPASVTEMVKILANDGYVEYERYHGVKLTAEGMNYARHIRKKHHVMETFLIDVLALTPEAAHEEACKLEHVISDDSMLRICKMMGTPIDKDCVSCHNPCKAASIERNVRCVNDLETGERGMISHVKSPEPSLVMKLVNMGFVPGKEITLIGKAPGDGPRIVTLCNDSIAIDYDMASGIYVEI